MQVSAFSVKISGDQGLPGYRESVDTTIVNASAQSPVSIEKDGSSYPMSCANRNGIYYCSHSFEKATLTGGEYVLIFKQESGEPSVLSWPFIVDEDAPLVKSFEVEDLGNGKLGLSYDIQDSAFFYDSGMCSGIDRITLSSDEEIISEQIIPMNGVCTKEVKNLSIDVSGVSGDVQFYLTVTDKLGQSNSEHSNLLKVDFQDPEVNNDLVIKIGNNTVEYVSSQGVFSHDVTVQFTVNEENLESVKADLRDLTRDPKYDQDYKEAVFNCNSLGLKSLCRAENINFNPGKGTVSVPVTVRDTFGNEITKTISASFTLINKQGDISYFGPTPDHCDEDICYIKNGVPEFLIQIVGADAGISPQFITLATSEISNSVITKASYCTETDPDTPVVDCYAYPIVTLGEQETTKKRVVLTNPTTDIMGTQLKGITSSLIAIDNNKPVAVSEFNYSIPGCSIAGETGVLSIQMKDDISTKLFISMAPELITGKDLFENVCESSSAGRFDCELKIDNFVSYPENENVSIEIRDLAGNVYIKNMVFKVCEANNDYPPNFIKSLKAESTMTVDRRVASIMPVNVYLPLEIDSGIAEIIDIDYVDCGEFVGDAPYFLKKSSDEPIFVVPIGGASEKVLPDIIPLNCTLNFYERRGNVRFIQPEVEQLSVNIETSYLSLGSPDEAAKEKLVSLAEELQVKDLKIRKQMKWMQFLLWLCEIDTLFTRINQVVSTVKSVVYATSLFLNLFSDAGEAIWDAACPVFHQINKFISKLMPTNILVGGAKGLTNKANSAASKFTEGESGNIVSIDPSETFKLKLGYFFKAGCMFIHCSQCSPEGIGQMAKMIKLGLTEKVKVADSGEEEGDGKKPNAKDRKAEIDGLKTKVEEAKESKNDASIFTSKDEKSLADLKVSLAYLNSVESDDKVWLNAEIKKVTGELEPIQSRLTNEKNLANARQDLWGVQLGTGHIPGERDELLGAMAEADLTAGDFIFSPFNNIYDSRSCACLTGNLYNHNKLKQLQCKRIKCIQSSITTGFPAMSDCDFQFSEEECLYYSGAREKRKGFDWIGGRLVSMFTKSYVARPVNTAFNILCGGLFGVADEGTFTGEKSITGKTGGLLSDSADGRIEKDGEELGFDTLGGKTGIEACKSQATGWLDSICAVRLAAIQSKDLTNTFQTGFFSDLAGHDLNPETDFCEGLDTTLGLLPHSESSTPGLGQVGLGKLVSNVEKNIVYPDPEEALWSN